MPSPRSKLGAQGERIAAVHLESLGLVIEARNYRARVGEIDLVARDGRETVFVEVRTKRSTAYGTPEESVTPRKQARLVKSAMQYLAEHGRMNAPWRVDIVGITLQSDGPARIVHIPSAVEDSGL